ncbi:GNAT family acetyltransferase [Nisaea acidiphila]|uniref:GNAT family acetyltransferase n=1 Tax=Nisaea acidiphila TaxID=1862145 RepID=A0A9J7AUR3_9PROT|nr:GNAT family acetyltransferase [Nisaea acidiphila]UUX50060.1 GNAT family acetyltransferase [Nisaea acidiphila]
MALDIRPIADGDTPAVVALWNAAGLTVPHNDPYEDIRFCQRSVNAEILLGFDGDRLAAAAMVGHDGHRGWYYYVGVDPAIHGGGHGREIMGAAENWLIGRGVGKAQLMIRSTNSKVKAFYERLGYVEEDRLVMAKRFRPVPDWKIGAVSTQVIHLEMKTPPDRAKARPPETGRTVTLERIGIPTTRFYRYLYDGVGGDWFWVSRRIMDDESLAQTLSREGAEYHLLRVDGEPAGYCELERSADGKETELSYFGLLPDFIGLGLGRYFIDAAIDLAWGPETERVWVHTCDLDHPRAIGNYMRAGFVPVARETEILPDPRDAGFSAPPAEADRGHAADSLYRDAAGLATLPDLTKRQE